MDVACAGHHLSNGAVTVSEGPLLRIGIDVGGTNTDAVLIEHGTVKAFTKKPTSTDVKTGITDAVNALLAHSQTAPGDIDMVMIGTTHFTNALVERRGLNKVGVIRLASPSGEALPPFTVWPEALVDSLGRHVYLLPGGYEVDGREISAFDADRVRQAVLSLKDQGIHSIAITSAFAPLNAQMERNAAQIVRSEFPEASVSLSHAIGRIGLVERENGTILNAALSDLGRTVVTAFDDAIASLGLTAALYISQNDGTLVSAAYAAEHPVSTIGSGPTNSMRGAAHLSGLTDAIVMDIGGTTSDIGVLKSGFPRESSIAVDIGGVRTNFRMPDILALAIGGGTRIKLATDRLSDPELDQDEFQVGPESVGREITSESYIFGGNTLTISDIAVAHGLISFGEPDRLPPLSDAVKREIMTAIRRCLEDGVDRMKTSSDQTSLIVVGGGSFLVGETFKGIQQIVSPPYAAVANAVGAAMSKVGAQIERIVNYDEVSRDAALAEMKQELAERLSGAGGDPETLDIVDIEDVKLSYLPGSTTQTRIRAVAELRETAPSTVRKVELNVAN